MKLSLALLVAAVLLCITQVWAYPAEDNSTRDSSRELNGEGLGTNAAPRVDGKYSTKEGIQDLKKFMFQYYNGGDELSDEKFNEISDEVGGPEEAHKILWNYYHKWHRLPGYYTNYVKARVGQKLYGTFGNSANENSDGYRAQIANKGKQMYNTYRYTLPFERVDRGVDSSGTQPTAPLNDETSDTSNEASRDPNRTSSDAAIVAGSTALLSDSLTNDDKYVKSEKLESSKGNPAEDSGGETSTFELDGNGSKFGLDKPKEPTFSRDEETAGSSKTEKPSTLSTDSKTNSGDDQKPMDESLPLVEEESEGETAKKTPDNQESSAPKAEQQSNKSGTDRNNSNGQEYTGYVYPERSEVPR
ncbi:hypothetical protein IWQ62_006332, partial [Dispira parvispora]